VKIDFLLFLRILPQQNREYSAIYLHNGLELIFDLPETPLLSFLCFMWRGIRRHMISSLFLKRLGDILSRNISPPQELK